MKETRSTGRSGLGVVSHQFPTFWSFPLLRKKEYVILMYFSDTEIYFHKPITVHLELYLFYRFIHFLLYIGQY